MDRRTIVVLALCVLAFVLYRPLMNRLGLGKYMEPPRPAPSAPARDTTRTAAAPTPAPAGTPAPTTPAPLAARPSQPSLGAAPPPQAIERSLHVETPLYDAQFSNLGARLVSVELKRFASAHGVSSLAGKVRRPKAGEDVPSGDRVVLAGAPTFELALGSGAALRPLSDLAYDVAESTDASGGIRTLTFTARDESGIHLRQTYRIDPDSYAIGLEVEIRDVPPTLPLTDYSLTVRSWPALTESDRLSDQRALRASSLVGTNLHRDGAIGLSRRPRSYDGNVAWAGVQSRYFVAVAALVQGSARGVAAHGEERPYPPGAIPRLERGERAVQEIAANTMIVSLPSPGQPVHRFVLYAGPSEYGQLAQLQGTQLERVVDLGWSWIRPISAVLLRLLHWIDVVVRNYGTAIIVLATLLRVLLHPLNMSSMKSMRAMQRLQPEMDRLRAKYKNDPQALNTQTMSLYKENKVNPAGGCLPMLIQMPVLIALYQVLFNAIELRQAPFVGWINDLSAPDLLFSLGSFPVRLLPLLMTASGFLLQRMTPTAPQQQPTAYLMNLFMLFIFYKMPSGLVLYWTVMNLLSALQQWLVLRQDGAVVVVREAAPEAPRKRPAARG